MDICLRLIKESNQSRSDGSRVRNSVLIMLPFGIVTCTFFTTTFLEIVVYVKLYEPIFYHAIVSIWFAYKQLNNWSYLFHAVYKDCLQTENQTCDKDS